MERSYLDSIFFPCTCAVHFSWCFLKSSGDVVSISWYSRLFVALSHHSTGSEEVWISLRLIGFIHLNENVIVFFDTTKEKI